jgi:hypothetical protein
MYQTLTPPRIDKIRSAARHIVRELGFMQAGLVACQALPMRMERFDGGLEVWVLFCFLVWVS